jgi:hypothetical protein
MNNRIKYSDDARRMADCMSLHAVAKSKGWAVFALADGRSDNVPYESLNAAYRSKKWDRDNYVYLQISPNHCDPAIMQGFLDYARMLHDAGARMPDPRDTDATDRDFPYHQPPLMRQDWSKQIYELLKKR